MAIDVRHRDKNGEIGRKHGNTLIRTLRKPMVPHFADGCYDDEKLSDVLHKMDEWSLVSSCETTKAESWTRFVAKPLS